MSRFAIIVGIGIALVIVVPLGGCAYYERGTARHVNLHVTDKIRTGGQDSKYLVYTNHGVFENTDALFWGKFNSSDLYGQLLRGKAYRCTVYGWRSHFLSWYPNLVSCEESR